MGSNSKDGVLQPFKVVLLGANAVGKTSVLTKLVDGVFPDCPPITIGASRRAAKIRIGGNEVPLDIWDTAGDESFQSAYYLYARGSNALVFVCSVEAWRGSEGLERVQEDFGNLVEKNVVDVGTILMLLVNKVDLEDKTGFVQKAREFAAQKRMLFFPVSARTGEGIREAFESIARALLFSLATPGYSMSSSANDLVNCLVVGDRQVGKTNLVSRFLFGSFSDEYKPTKSFLPQGKDLSIDGRSLSVQIRELSETEGFGLLRVRQDELITIIVVYDVTDPATFANVQRWLSAARQVPGMTASGIWTFVVGNKTDLIATPAATSSTRRKSAGATHLHFFNVSAKTGSNIPELRQAVIATSLNRGINPLDCGRPKKK
jgi:small GTP-binding protein